MVKTMERARSLAATDVKQWLTEHVRQHQVRAASSALNERLNAEMMVVRECTILHIAEGKLPPARLETVKDYLRSLKGNPFGVTPDGSSADAKVQKDMRHICGSALMYEGQPTQIVGKSLHRNAVIFIDVALAGQLIAAEKDKAKQAEMKGRLAAVTSLKTRAGYERR